MMKRLCAAALTIMIAACGGSSSSNDSFAAATPDVAGLTLETTAGANDGAALVAGAPLDSALFAAATTTTPTTCQPWQYTCKIHQAVRAFNEYVTAVVGPVEALATTQPTILSDGTHVYGPADVPADNTVATVKLTVKQGVAGRYRWKLEGRPKTSTNDSDYVIVMAGWLRPGDLPHRGAGVLAIDLAKLASLTTVRPAPDGFRGAGQILAAFKHVGQAKSLAFVLKGFIPDTTVSGAQPIDAAFVGHKTPSGEAGVRLASIDELLAPASGSDTGRELLLARGRWVPGLGGRTAIVLTDWGTGTDVASYSSQIGFHVDYLLGTSCWKDVASGNEVEAFHGLFACRGIGPFAHCVALPPPASWITAGFNPTAQDISACKPGTELADDTNPPASIDHNATNPEPGGDSAVNGVSIAPDTSSIPSSIDDVKF